MAYNGWTNYETWRVNLELLSDYCDTLDLSEYDTTDLAETLAEYADEVVESTSSGLGLDYARAFLAGVDFWEVATTHLADRED
jgi:hypothetical protein